MVKKIIITGLIFVTGSIFGMKQKKDEAKKETNFYAEVASEMERKDKKNLYTDRHVKWANLCKATCKNENIEKTEKEYREALLEKKQSDKEAEEKAIFKEICRRDFQKLEEKTKKLEKKGKKQKVFKKIKGFFKDPFNSVVSKNQSYDLLYGDKGK